MHFPDFNPFAIGPFGPFHLGAFEFGPIGVRWYALAYISGILLGWRYAVRLIRTPRLWGAAGAPVTAEQIDDFVLWATLGVIIGGRLGHVIFYDPELLTHDPVRILRVWEGGMSFHGGAIGVGVAMIGFAWRNKVDLWRLADMTSVVVPIGLFFGRVANFVNGELWGRTTDAPWGMVFCNTYLMQTDGCAAGPLPRHPSQLYEAGLEGFVLLGVLSYAAYRLGLLRRPGVVTGLFVAFYGLFRILLENVRQPDAGLVFGLTRGMALSIPMVLFGLVLIWRGLRATPIPE